VGNQHDYLFLLIGSLLSGVAMMGYMIFDFAYRAKGKKRFIAMFLGLGGLIPWAFASYIFFVRGLWSLTNLVDGFSIVVILKAIVYVILGYTIVSKLLKITELK